MKSLKKTDLSEKVDEWSKIEKMTMSEGASYSDLDDTKTFSIWRIVGICSAMLSYQIAYSVEFALGTPIMLRLGVSQVASTFIWLSGPLAGFFVQPLVGYYSDMHQSKLGRRRPYIIWGGIGIAIGFLLLYFVEPLGTLFNRANPRGYEITFVSLALLITNVAINILQGPSRALVGDIIPQSQQVTANTIGSLMIGIAAVVANLVGGLQLSKYTGGRLTNDQIVIIVGVFLIIVGMSVTLLTAHEKPIHGVRKTENPFKEIFRAAKNIPRPVLKISIVYLFSWMAYYPFNIGTTDFFAQDIFHGNVKDKNDPNYVNGVSFGMLVIALSNVLVLLYSPFQTKFISFVGLRWAYALSQILEAICLFVVYFVVDKYSLMLILAPLGISCTIFNSIPFAVVGQCVSQEQMGMYMGVLNSFAVTGQQMSNWILGAGITSFFSGKAVFIASGFVFALIAAFMCQFIQVEGNDHKNTPLLQDEK